MNTQQCGCPLEMRPGASGAQDDPAPIRVRLPPHAPDVMIAPRDTRKARMIGTTANGLSRPVFVLAIGLIIGIKCLIALYLPLLGDEAYFIVWGRQPALGFYEHPPMAGWWMSLMLLLGEQPLVLRLPAILTSMTPALVLFLVCRRIDADKARMLTLLALLIPLFMFGVMLTTDTPLIFFGTLSLWVCWLALRTDRKLLFLISGLLLGAAFMSKYFAALLGIGYLVHFLLFVRRQFLGLLLILVGTLPFVAVNLYWNWQNCWYNLMFNFLNRHAGSEVDWLHVPLYLIMLVYLFTPWVLWFIWRDRQAVIAGIRRHRLGVFFTTGVVGLLIFLAMAPGARIGLHWVALFTPLLLLAAIFLPAARLRQSLIWMGIFAAVHGLVVVLVLSIPTGLLAGHPWHTDVVSYLHPQKMRAITEDQPADVYFFTRSYSRSAVFSHYTGRHFGVLASNSHSGRQYDISMDFRALDGAHMVVVMAKGESRPEIFQPLFDEIEIREVQVAGAPFILLEGRGFRYTAYRDIWLARARDTYYQFPDWLPPGRCGFLERYFSPEADSSREVPGR